MGVARGQQQRKGPRRRADPAEWVPRSVWDEEGNFLILFPGRLEEPFGQGECVLRGRDLGLWVGNRRSNVDIGSLCLDKESGLRFPVDMLVPSLYSCKLAVNTCEASQSSTLTVGPELCQLIQRGEMASASGMLFTIIPFSVHRLMLPEASWEHSIFQLL